MKNLKSYIGVPVAGLLAIMVYGCKTSTPGDAVKAAMQKEIIKEKVEDMITEDNVPEVVVEAFNQRRPEVHDRSWFIYEQTPEQKIDLALPEVYIVAFSEKGENYKAKYSKEGDILELNHLIDLSVLPRTALDVIQKGDYKDWKVVGDVYETLDNDTKLPVGFIVTVSKGDEKNWLFFDVDGTLVKIQTLTP
jgi:hypothetical protein